MDLSGTPRLAPRRGLTLRVLTQIAWVDGDGRVTRIREIVSVNTSERQQGISAEQAGMLGLL